MIGDYIGVVLDYLGLTLQETLLASVLIIMLLMFGKVGKK